MLKKTVNYEDWDGNPQSEVLYFNLSKSDIADNLELSEELTAVGKMLEGRDGSERVLTIPEVKSVLHIIKKLVKISYGKRSADGKQFVKSDEAWDEFRWSGAYDHFLISLFEDPSRATEFLQAIVPKDLREQAEKQVKENPQQVVQAVAASGIDNMTEEELRARLAALEQSKTQQ